MRVAIIEFRVVKCWSVLIDSYACKGLKYEFMKDTNDLTIESYFAFKLATEWAVTN